MNVYLSVCFNVSQSKHRRQYGYRNKRKKLARQRVVCSGPSAVSVRGTSSICDIIFTEQHVTFCTNLPPALAFSRQVVMLGQISPDTETPGAEPWGFLKIVTKNDLMCLSRERPIQFLIAAPHSWLFLSLQSPLLWDVERRVLQGTDTTSTSSFPWDPHQLPQDPKW